MPATDPALFTCPACGAAYRWRSETSGRKAQCARCAAIMRVPATPGVPAVLLAGGTTGTTNPAAPPTPLSDAAPEDPLPALVDDDEPFNPLDGADDEPPEALATGDYELAQPQPLPADPPQQPPANQPAQKRAQPADSAPSDDYELAEPQQPDDIEPVRMKGVTAGLATTPGRCPNCGMNLKPGAVLCLNCGYHVSQGAKIETQVIATDAPAEPGEIGGPVALTGQAVGQATMAVEHSRRQKQDLEDHRTYMWREIHIPLMIIVAGLLLILFTGMNLLWIQKPVPPSATATAAAAALQNLASATGTPAPTVVPVPTAPPVPSPGMQRVVALSTEAAFIIIQLPFLFMGLLLVGRLFGTAFGPLVPGMIKLIAMAVAADAATFLAKSLLGLATEGLMVPGADLIYGSVSFVAFWGLSAFLFELEYKEVLLLYFFSLLMPVILVMVVITAFL